MTAIETSPLPRGFNHVDAWVFDLDNTLYPPACDLFAQVDQKMAAYICDLLGVDVAEARRIQKEFYIEYGTTLSGLMAVHGCEPEPFLDFVHDIDVSGVMADEALGAAIARLPGRKIIFTNGSLAHAENVLRQLRIDHVFDGIYDIVTARYEPKPRRGAYDRFIEASGIEPSRAAMFEDIARNLEVPHTLGMTTVWVRPGVAGPERHHQISFEGADGPHIHHVTDVLREFLTSHCLAASATAE
ncbi:pyrimidine 5'-nucleotidase [Parvibaculum sp.]|jgi:putative hydrolase of the HAD superfamily|uniref:pyrimidine 5'-nucleotidase n=1 Tax=Parvibaculum sp. TaxID=2024848 RepID=UPI003C773C9C